MPEFLTRSESNDPDQRGILMTSDTDDFGGAAVSTSHLALTKDLSTHPNTEDNAVVEQAGLTITGPAWVQARFVVSPLTVPALADAVGIEIHALGEAWVSGTANASVLVGASPSEASSSEGGIFTAQASNTRLFVPSGVGARVGLVVQPVSGGNPVAGQPTGTLTAIIVVESTA